MYVLYRHTKYFISSLKIETHYTFSFQSLSRIRLFSTSQTAARKDSLSITNSWSLLKLIEFHRVGDAIQPSYPLSSPSPPAFSLTQHQGLFKWVSSLYQVAKVLEFQLQHQSFREYSGLISFRIDWFDLLAIQGTLKSLLQHRSSKASILQCSAFCMVQLLHPYMTTGKATVLTRRTFVRKDCLCFLICCLGLS